MQVIQITAAKTFNNLGIDVPTKGKGNLIRRLKALSSTLQVADAGAYREDQQFSQVHITTAKTEEQLDAWLYQTKGIDYVGTFVR